MAAKAKQKVFTVRRDYRVQVSADIKADSIQDAAAKLSDMGYGDFTGDVLDTEPLSLESIWTNT